MPMPVDIGNRDPYTYYFEVFGQTVRSLCNNVNTIDFSPGFEKSQRTFPTVEQMQPIVEKFNEVCRIARLFELRISDPAERISFANRFKSTMSPFIQVLSSKVLTAYTDSRSAEKTIDPSKVAMIDFELGVLSRENKAYLKALKVTLNLLRNDAVPRNATESERAFFSTLSDRF